MLFRQLFSTRMRINSASYFVFALRNTMFVLENIFSVVVPRGVGVAMECWVNR